MVEIEGGIRPRNPAVFSLLALFALLVFSEHLALHRIFQVDEFENVFTARLLATGQAKHYLVGAQVMLLGPMMWIARAIDHGAMLMRAERLLYLALFWVNLALIVRAAGFRIRSRRGLIAFLFVATLAPLWDYGFEIRHDNVLLTAILLGWIWARPLGSRKRNVFIVAMLATVAQFLAFKSFAYMAPIALFAVLAAKLEDKRPVWRSVLDVASGFLAGLAAVAAAHWLSGTWPQFMIEFQYFGKLVAMVSPFTSAIALNRLVVQTPVLLLLLVYAAIYAARKFRLQTVVSREGVTPEAFLFAIAVVAILVNPTPFPYNLVLFVPQAAIFVLRLHPVAQSVWTSGRAAKVLLILAIALHGFFWFHSTLRHLRVPNDRQLALITTAEEMTDPAAHAVLSGAGLVPTRNPPGYFWLIHSFTAPLFDDRTYPSMRRQLAEGRTPVIIPNYQLTVLSAADQQFIREHYVGLAGDFLVAGGIMKPGRQGWQCLVPGRYYLSAPAGGLVVLDGRPVRQGAVQLLRGPHTIEARSDGPVWLSWLGPNLETPPALGPGNSTQVLVNWY